MKLEHRLVTRFGRTYVEYRYVGDEWCDWLFPASTTPHRYWKYIPEYGLYVSNVSIK